MAHRIASTLNVVTKKMGRLALQRPRVRGYGDRGAVRGQLGAGGATTYA